MKEHNLIASVALFGGLYNNAKYNNVTDIIAEFIKAAVCSENLWSINSTQITSALQDIFDFTIPEAVIKTVLKRNTPKLCSFKDGVYTFNASKLQKDWEILNREFVNIDKCHEQIHESLYEFIEVSSSTNLDASQRTIVREHFTKYLLDNNYNETYSNQISAFIVRNKDNEAFINNLNQIKEGLILYQGVKYTSDVNDLGSWNTELKIFLNTEYLFNAVGYNGEVYKQMFADFWDLTNKINQKSRNKKNEKLIELRYLDDTEKEIDDFFMKAEMILRGNQMADPSRAAMREILNGCRTPADVRGKKLSFIKEINQLGISLQKTDGIYSYHDYVVDDESSIPRLKADLKDKGRHFLRDEYDQICRIFTKVNYFRGGKSNTKFERIGHIHLTGKSFALWLAQHPTIKEGDNIPFALTIETLTSKFWFKLCKGFGENPSLPKSLEVVTRAQVILSSQLSSSVGKIYDDLQQKFKDGTHDKEWLLGMSYELRDKAKLPEEIDITTVEESLDLIMEDEYIEHFYKDREFREQQVNALEIEKAELQSKIHIYEQQEQERKEAQLKQQRDLKIEAFIQKRHKEHMQKERADIWYFLRAGAILFLAILLVGVSRIDAVAAFLVNKELLATIIIIVLALLGANELFVRTFIWDKERVKTGRKKFLLRCQPRRRQKVLEMHKVDWISDFNKSEEAA